MSPQQNKKSTANLPRRPVKAPFFDRDIHVVARDLLGRDLIRHRGGVVLRARIVEVEVYEGPNDAASHASSGVPTARTEPMFGDPGTIYVYTVYGMHQCLNLRAPSSVGPGAILIRACRPLQGKAYMALARGLVDAIEDYDDDESMQRNLMSGPAKLCQALTIDTDFSGTSIGDELSLAEGEAILKAEPTRIKATARIGLNKKTCGECTERPWRYVVADSKWASR